ncbi:serine/threonine-protein kinase LMTK1 isoform X1 [Electrophorus electricus]|uniref:serine/threonine-protein kinase LMTK1 isoform X1 n=1 Tax=Electrophorus electricus TaxID=8005 RepID=UPI0015D00DBC|nr:serine/threonine-protein kinase LMTK1 isoform X1 [Electrophorus electricus]
MGLVSRLVPGCQALPPPAQRRRFSRGKERERVRTAGMGDLWDGEEEEGDSLTGITQGGDCERGPGNSTYRNCERACAAAAVVGVMCLTEVFLVRTEPCLFIPPASALLRDGDRDGTVKTGLLCASYVTAGGLGAADVLSRASSERAESQRAPERAGALKRASFRRSLPTRDGCIEVHSSPPDNSRSAPRPRDVRECSGRVCGGAAGKEKTAAFSAVRELWRSSPQGAGRGRGTSSRAVLLCFDLPETCLAPRHLARTAALRHGCYLLRRRLAESQRSADSDVLIQNIPVQLLKSADLGRHRLLYLKEIGHDWFGKVLLGQVNAGLSTTQVVVKELKASCSVQEQMQFLDEAQPFRTLQHSALLQCLAQCTEVTPYLLIMEYCPLGDVKGYLRSCRAADSATPDPSVLQRMACDIASGVLYLHKHSYVHSDLALRNCLLTSEMTVKVGDYGLSHSRYKDDYFVTADQIWVPLRWIAPELIDEVHGNLLVVDQTKASNVWSLGVTIWELFELGNQPYRHYSDRQVLTYAVKEQQLKLPKPLLKVALSERWYEVMQFCWLQPELRPLAEEVHLLLNYLCARGSSAAEEDFEKRWNSLRPSLGSGSSQRTPAVPDVAPSSFPLLEHFSTADGFHSENGDDILTVTETSHGLNFEYKWEQARAEQPYCSSSASGPLGRSNPHYQDIYYPLSNTTESCRGEGLTLGVSPSYYESDHPGVVPVLSAHSPSVSSEYYIRIEEPVECNINLEEDTFDYSPGIEASQSSFCMTDTKTPKEAQANTTYWSAAKDSTSNAYDSDGSPTVALTLEPLQRRTLSPSTGPVEQSSQYFCPNDRDRFYCEKSPSEESEVPSKRGQPFEYHVGSGSLHHAEEQKSPHRVSLSLSSPSLGHCDPYLEANQRTAEKSMANETYYDMMGRLGKNMSRPHYMTIEVEAGDGLLMGAAGEGDDDNQFTENEATNWTSNHSANNNSLNFDGRQARGSHDTYLDFRHTTPTPSSHVQSSRPVAVRDNSSSNIAHALDPHSYTEAVYSNSSTINVPYTDSECGSYIHLCSEGGKEVESSARFPLTSEKLQIIHPAQKTTPHLHNRESAIHLPVASYATKNTLTLPADITVTKEELFSDRSTSPIQDTRLRSDGLHARCRKNILCPEALSERVSECSHVADSWMESGCSSISLVDIDDCTDNDITDIASEVFPGSPVEFAEVGDVNLADRPLHRDPENITDLASSSSPCEAFSPDVYHTCILPKSLDSGYDTENNESPEFVMKDLEGKPVISTSVESECEMVLQMDLEDTDVVVQTPTSNGNLILTELGERSQYRDSAYFSDCDTENDKSPSEGGSTFFDNQVEDDVFGHRPSKDNSPRKTEGEGNCSACQKEECHAARLTEGTNDDVLSAKQCLEKRKLSDLGSVSVSAPVIMVLSPFPPEMGGCLTKESAPDDGLGLESEHSGDEPVSDCFSSTASEDSSTTQEATATEDQANSAAKDFSSADSLGSDSTIVEFSGEISKDSESGEDSLESQMDRKDEQRDVVEEEEEVTVGENGIDQALLRVKQDSSLDNILPVLPEDLDIAAPLGNGEEAEEEDSDDSDESDEELRSYNVQEQSDESEEEFTTVPVVVSERSSARHLRSLLKMPALLTQSFCDELERKKKAVSFFDDVTVFLFDQESPTGELSEYTFPPGTEPDCQQAEGTHPQPEKIFGHSDNSSGKNISEESRPFGWEEDYSLMPSPSTLEPRSHGISTPPNSPARSPEEKPAPQLSRFSVSRFSITHVSDSDMDSTGGSNADGDQE